MVSSQNFQWANGFGSSGLDQGRSIATDDFENIYSTGLLQGTADFDPGAGVYNLSTGGNAHIFILKINSLGNFLMAKNIGGSSGVSGAVVMSISIDASGIYLTGGVSE